MSSITTGVGLVSGVNFTQIVDALIEAQRGTTRRLADRVEGLNASRTGIAALEANVLSVEIALNSFGFDSLYDRVSSTNSDESQVRVSATSAAEVGSYAFQTLQTAAQHSVRTQGFAASTVQPGAGTLTLATGGELNRETLLDALNNGQGVAAGSIRITDRSGNSAEIDLSAAVSVEDVLTEVNNSSVSVTANLVNDQFVITDTSGSTAGNLIVDEVNGGSVAADLGLVGSVAADSLTGSTVFSVFEGLTLDQINDGNGLRRVEGGADFRITLTDDSTIEINLDEAATLGDVIAAINSHEENDGKVSAEIENGRLKLTDTSGGGGSSSFQAEDINGAAVVRQLGLDVSASGGGTELTGNRLAAGANSVLLRNLNGGAGITERGQITITDRTGTSATLDLSNAESLDEVLAAINSANDGGTPLQITARLSDTRTGIVLEDTSGATASNLIVADVATGTLAADLNIAVDDAVNQVSSGNLARRYVNEATSLATYAPDGTPLNAGTLTITDSAGNSADISITTAVTNVGDILQRINNAAGISVTAELNATGDGFVIIDEAAGSESLTITDDGSGVAADLRLTGAAVAGGDGKDRISSRLAVVVDVAADATLEDLVDQLNEFSGTIAAELVNDGTTFNSTRLSIQSVLEGQAGRLIIESSGFDLGFETVTEGQDARLLATNTAGTSLRTSGTNFFDDVFTGVDVTARQTAATAAEVTIARDDSSLQGALQSFVSSYNTFIGTASELTKFDFEGGERGVLQGSSVVSRVQQRLEGLVFGRIGNTGEVRSLFDVGINVTTGGRLTFDEDRFQSAIDNDADAVNTFFRETGSGFADVAKETMDTLTDPFTGTLVTETNSLTATIDTLGSRISDLESILEVRRVRLLEQFVQMENIISSITSQQQALAAFSPVPIVQPRSS